jgi:phage baseplate assembly protein gpV
MSTSSEEVGRELATALGDGPGRSTLAAQRVLVMEMAQRSFRPRPRPTAWTYALAAGVVLAAVALGVTVFSTQARPLAASFRGVPIATNAPVTATEKASDALDFSDGSQVVLDKSARATLSELSPKHAALRLEKGRVSASIRKHPGMSWTVMAGPYAVTVVGTRFSVDWDERTSALEVLVREGRVRVTGGDLPAAGVLLDPGGRLERRAPMPATYVPSKPPAVAAERPVADAPASDPKSEAALAPSGGAAIGALATKGKYKEALALAEKQGFTRLVGELPENDLLLLANAARYSSDARRAREAFGALRQRFAGRPGATLAALYLAKVAEDMTREPAEAIRWLRVFLRESPAGDLAEGARASLMSLLLRTGDQAGARSVAKDYLRFHPTGSHAGDARALTAE